MKLGTVSVMLPLGAEVTLSVFPHVLSDLRYPHTMLLSVRDLRKTRRIECCNFLMGLKAAALPRVPQNRATFERK